MCGITGMVTWQEDVARYQADLKRMQAVLSNRGPDQQGMYQDTHCAMAHTRLAVIDVERGKQPMTRQTAMKYTLKPTTQFKRDLKKAQKQNKNLDLLNKVLQQLADGIPDIQRRMEILHVIRPIFRIYNVHKMYRPKLRQHVYRSTNHIGLLLYKALYLYFSSPCSFYFW